MQGPVAVFSSKAAAAIAAARMRQADGTQLASAPAGALSPDQQQQDPSKAVGQHTIVRQKPNVSFGGRSQHADWSQSAVVLPRPCSAAAPQQRPKASHARTAASRPQSAHVNAAVGSSHQHRALSTTAALPKPRSTAAAAAAAASSSGKASIGLAASGNVTLRAASASSIQGTALSKQTALPSHSNAVRSDLHQRAVQSQARSRPQVQSLSQLSLPSRKRSRPLSAASSSHLNQPVYFHARYGNLHISSHWFCIVKPICRVQGERVLARLSAVGWKQFCVEHNTPKNGYFSWDASARLAAHIPSCGWHTLMAD